MKRTKRSPVSIMGGKFYLADNIVKLIPPHKIYVEVYGGSGAVLFRKEPSPVEVYNDLNSDLVNFFRVLRNEKQFAEIYTLLSNTPYSLQEFNEAVEWKQQKDPVLRAYYWFLRMKMGFNGMGTVRDNSGWRRSKLVSRRGMSQNVSAWLSSIELLSYARERLLTVQVEHRPAIDILQDYDSEDTFAYIDPPYYPDTLTDQKGYYTHVMSNDEHEELLNVLLSLKSKVLLSGYNCLLYNTKLEKWNKIELDVPNLSQCVVDGGNKARRTEVLWKNY